jgi:ferredoxin
MKVRVDPTKCQGFGRCAELCPEVFILDEWGFASAKDEGVVPAGSEVKAQEAVDACPEGAILKEE